MFVFRDQGEVNLTIGMGNDQNSQLFQTSPQGSYLVMSSVVGLLIIDPSGRHPVLSGHSTRLLASLLGLGIWDVRESHRNL